MTGEAKRVVPLKAQCAAGHEIVAKALAGGSVLNEYKEAATSLLKTLDWLMSNEEAVKLAARCLKHPDVLEAIGLVLDTKTEFPEATLHVKQTREPRDDV